MPSRHSGSGGPRGCRREGIALFSHFAAVFGDKKKWPGSHPLGVDALPELKQLAAFGDFAACPWEKTEIADGGCVIIHLFWTPGSSISHWRTGLPTIHNVCIFIYLCIYIYLYTCMCLYTCICLQIWWNTTKEDRNGSNYHYSSRILPTLHLSPLSNFVSCQYNWRFYKQQYWECSGNIHMPMIFQGYTCNLYRTNNIIGICLKMGIYHAKSWPFHAESAVLIFKPFGHVLQGWLGLIVTETCPTLCKEDIVSMFPDDIFQRFCMFHEFVSLKAVWMPA